MILHLATKTCSKCRTEKPLSAFTVRSECKVCQAEYRGANKTRIASVNKAWRRANREYILARNKEWNSANPEKHRASIDGWWRSHPEKRREKDRKRRAAEPETIREYNRTRRARKLTAEGHHTADQVTRLLIEQDHRCANPCCRADLRTVKRSLDHKMPLARGGSNNIDNLQWLCAPCNCRKWTFTQDEWLARELKAAA